MQRFTIEITAVASIWQKRIIIAASEGEASAQALALVQADDDRQWMLNGKLDIPSTSTQLACDFTQICMHVVQVAEGEG